MMNETLKIYTSTETTFISKALDLLGIDFNLEMDIQNGKELTHNEFTFKINMEQKKLLANLMRYNYENNM